MDEGTATNQRHSNIYPETLTKEQELGLDRIEQERLEMAYNVREKTKTRTVLKRR